MKESERDELFLRARKAASPGQDDQRRVRAALRRRLGVAAGVSLGVTGAKAAASVGPTGLLAGAGVSGLALAKAATVLIAVAAVGLAVVPARRRQPATRGGPSSALSITPVTLPPSSPLNPRPTLGVSPPPVGSGAELDIPAPPTLASPSATSEVPPRPGVEGISRGNAALHALPGTPPGAAAENHTLHVSLESPHPVGD